MGERMRSHDWTATTLGSPAHWPQSLKSMLSACLNSPLLGTVLWGPDLLFLYNDAYIPSLADRHPTALGRPVSEVWDEAWEQVSTPFYEAMRTGEGFSKSSVPVVMTRMGIEQTTYWDFTAAPIRGENGDIVGLLNQGVETTDRVEAIEGLRKLNATLERRVADALAEQRMLAEIVEATDVLVTVLARDFTMLASNTAFADMFERVYGVRPHVGDNVLELLANRSEEQEAVRSVWERVFAGEDYTLVQDFGDPSIERRAFELKYRCLKNEAGECIGGYQFVTEVSDLRRELSADLERQVIERTQERGRTWSITPYMLSVIDLATGIFDQVNPAWTKTLGWSTAELEGSVFADFVHPEDLAASYAGLAATSRGDPLLSFENRYRNKAGAYRWLRSVSVPGEGKLYSTTRDVTDEKVRAEELAARTAERDRMWETSPDLMLVIDFDGVFRRVNPAWTTVLGYAPEELVGHHVNEFVLPDDHENTSTSVRVAAEGGTPTLENRYRHKDGSVRCISWTAAPSGDMGYATGRDVTAEKLGKAKLEQAQEALRQSQKMEALGSLTGGVAHDFNNLLTPIVGSLDMLQRKGIGGVREQRLIDGALQSAERARTLVQRLLAFARRQPLQPKPTDLGRLVTSMAELIASTTGPNINVVLEVAKGLPAAVVDPNQIEMAILNLSVNARDAMENGGTLRISASVKEVHERHHLQLEPGSYVRLLVADTGDGMDEGILSKAVEPFFSTKGIGRGTGLGLSMVHGLASQLGGALAIESTPGVGTDVEIWLPASTQSESSVPQTSASIPIIAAVGTVLLVDDEEAVRASTADMLADLGYAVVEASSAEEALRLLDEGLAFDMLVTDHLMPGMTGTELAREVRDRKVGAPIMLVSGYADVEGVAPDLPRLTKPFRQADLAAKISELEAAMGA